MTVPNPIPSIFTPELEQNIITQLIDARRLLDEISAAERTGLSLGHFRKEVERHIAFLENVHREYYGLKS